MDFIYNKPGHLHILWEELFLTLPNYDLNLLSLKGRSMALTFTVSLAFVITNLIAQIDEDSGFDLVFMLVIWAITILFSQKLFNSLMEKKFVFILLCPFSNSTPDNLIHKTVILKDFQSKATSLEKHNKKISQMSLVLSELNAKKHEIFQVPMDLLAHKISCIQKNKDLKKLIAASLSNALVRIASNNPKAENLKLFCAYYFGKKLKQYGVAVRLLEELETSTHKYTINLNVLILKHQFEEDIKSRNYQENTGLKLSEFIKQTSRFEIIKEEMLYQADIQNIMYKEWYRVDKFDLAVLQKCSQEIEHYKIRIKRRLYRLFERSPDYFIEPLIAAAYYSALVNFSPTDFASYFKTYSLRSIKYQAKFTKSELIPENIYHKDTFTLLVSCNEHNFGTIISCSANVAQIIGWNKDFLIGRTLFSIVPRSFIKAYSIQMREFTDLPSEEFVKASSIFYLLHSDGHLIPLSYGIAMNSSIKHGLSTYLTFRPANATIDYILISERGTVEACTKNIANKLNLRAPKASDIPIGELSLQLKELDAALNTIITATSHLQNRQDRRMSSQRGSVSIINTAIPSEDRSLNQSTTTKRSQNHKHSTIRKKEISLDEAQSLYSEYCNPGKSLRLAPLASVEDKSYNAAVMPIFYLCNIQLIKHTSGSIKILSLQRQFHKDDRDTNTFITEILLDEPTMKTLKVSKTISNSIKQNVHKHTPQNSELDLNSENFGEQEEASAYKNITFGDQWAQESRKIEKSKYPRIIESNFDASNNKIISFHEEIRKDVHEIKVFTREQISPDPSNSPQQVTSKTLVATHDMRLFTEADKERIRQNKNSLLSPASSSTRIFDEKRIYKALQVALDFKTYPKNFLMLIFIFCLLVFAFVISQTALGFNVKNHFGALNWQKEVMINARSRSDFTLRFSRRLRGTWAMGSGITNETLLNKVIPNIRTVLLTLSTAEVKELMILNKNLALDASFLDQEQSKVMFMPNVKFYDRLQTDSEPEIFMDLTTFQAVDKLYAQAIKIIEKSKVNVTAAVPGEDAFFKNALNNVLVQNRKSVDIIWNYLLNSKEKFIIQSAVVISFPLALLCLFVLLFAMFMKNMYNREVCTLTNVSKIPQESIKVNIEQLSKFKNVIAKAAYYEEANISYVTKSSRFLFRFNQEAKNYMVKNEKKAQNRHFHKKIQQRFLQGKYTRYVIVFFIFLLCVMILTALKLSWFFTNTNKMYKQVEKIKFIKQVEEEASLAIAVYIEVILTNGTGTILNIPAEEFYQMQMNKLNDIWLVMSEEFLDKNGNSNGYIQNILTTDICQFVGSSALASCTKIIAGSKETGLLKFLVMFRNLLKTAVDSFLDSPRTLADTQRVYAGAVGLSIPYINIVTILFDDIASALEGDLGSMHEAILHENNVFLAIYPCIVLLLCVLVWIFSLKWIKIIENDLKKVLKCFSVNSVVKTYGLKSFLLETSGGRLAAIKNDI